MWFNQGLNLLHDYWDYESARAFEQAVAVDTKCPCAIGMRHVLLGLYKAESFYHSTTMGYAGQAPARRWTGRQSEGWGQPARAPL